MYLLDYHTHSRCSPDSEAPLWDMVQAARQAGLRELCTTDHCDLLREDGSLLESWDWTPILEQFEEVSAQLKANHFRLCLGLELGEAQEQPELARQIVEGAPLDLVIGSIHNMSLDAGGRDLFYVDLTREETCREVLEDYMSSLLRLAPLPHYDVLGHIIYPLRYINGRGGHHMTLEPWQDQLDEVLRIVIESGRSIEVNTHGGREIEQWRPVLERYRELGGELVTLASDAHRPGNVARGLPQAAQLLLETGFQYVTRYRRRRPEPIKLNK